jgi:aryl-alcohol dehydrogenase-like predicted oxidoreductase
MPTRRRFLQQGTSLAALAAIRGASAAPLTRPLPATGEALPVIGLGGWRNFDLAPTDADWTDAKATLRAFVDGGGRVLDSSPMYGRSSEALGRIATELGVQDRLFWASKVWTRGSAAGRAQLAGERQRLGRARIDLVKVHNLSDVLTQLAVLREAREAGTLRLIGVSHYLSSAHEEVARLLRREPIDVLQVNYSIREPEAGDGLLALAAERGVAVFLNRVFAEGALFATVRGQPLPGFAAELGITSWAQYFLKWVLADPAVTVALTGTGNPRHIADNLAAGSGALPDAALRRRMAEFVRAL